VADWLEGFGRGVGEQQGKRILLDPDRHPVQMMSVREPAVSAMLCEPPDWGRTIRANRSGKDLKSMPSRLDRYLEFGEL